MITNMRKNYNNIRHKKIMFQNKNFHTVFMKLGNSTVCVPFPFATALPGGKVNTVDVWLFLDVSGLKVVTLSAK